MKTRKQLERKLRKLNRSNQTFSVEGQIKLLKWILKSYSK